MKVRGLKVTDPTFSDMSLDEKTDLPKFAS